MTKSDRPWVANGPEDRLSIALDRFLDRALAQPCYYTAIHDKDGGGRTPLQRARDVNRGVKVGQLDWEVWQRRPDLGWPVISRIELKRGANKPTANQLVTIAKLTECGAPPIVAWDLSQVYDGMRKAGFSFHANAATSLQHCEELLAAWDREADDILSGAVVKKQAKPRKAGPRNIATGKRAGRMARVGMG